MKQIGLLFFLLIVLVLSCGTGPKQAEPAPEETAPPVEAAVVPPPEETAPPPPPPLPELQPAPYRNEAEIIEERYQKLLRQYGLQ